MNILKIKSGLFSLLTIFTVSVFLTSCEQDYITNGIDNVTNPTLDEQFKSYEIIEIDNNEVWNTVENQIDGEVNLEMRKASSNPVLANWSFNMKPIQVEAEDFTMNLIEEGGKVTQVEMPKIHVLMGQLDGNAGEVFMGISKDNFWAEVIDGDVTYMIEPLIDYISDAKPNEYVKYNVADIIITGELTCGFDESQFQIEETEVPDNIEDRADNCWKVEVTYMGDYAFYRKFSNAIHAYEWMYRRVISASRLFHSPEYNNFGLKLILKRAYLDVSNSPNMPTSYDSKTFLTQWENYANNNAWWLKKGDANILFTARKTSSVGEAVWKSICNPYSYAAQPYGYVQYHNSLRTSNIITAHEIAHIVGAEHSSGLMADNLGKTSYDMSIRTIIEIGSWLRTHGKCMQYSECK